MKASKRSISRQLAAILLALCMCVGGVAATTTPAYAAASTADTGDFYVERPGYLLMSNLSSNKTFTLKWKQVSGASGYQVQVSKYSNFSSVIRGSIVRSSASSITVKITTPGYFYCRVRAYVTVNGTRYYSSWTRCSSAYKW